MASTVATRIILNKHHDRILAVVIAGQVKGESFPDRVRLAYKLTRKSSFGFLIYKLIESSGYQTLLFFHKLFRTGRFKDGTATNIIDLAHKYNIHIIKAGSLNNPDFLYNIAKLNADYILCIVGQVLGKIVFEKLGNRLLNVHGAYLPKYRGAAQYFWYLLNKDRTCGVTLHFMTPSIDSGNMILRERFGFDSGISAYRLHYLLGERFGKTFNLFIGKIAEEKTIKTIVQNEKQATYLRMPTNPDISRFRQDGHRMITLADFLDCI